TVHVLDDGFQHLELARDVDLLLVAEEDLQDRPMPAGRLREGLEAARAADAALITAGYDTAAGRIGRAFGVAPVFRVTRATRTPHQAPRTFHETPSRVLDRPIADGDRARHARSARARGRHDARPGVLYRGRRASPHRATQSGDGVSIAAGSRAPRHRPRRLHA